LGRAFTLFALQKSDVDFDAGVIMVSGSHDRDISKGGRVEPVPINDELVPDLKKAITASPSPGRPGSEGRFHHLRHSTASLLLMKGADLAAVQRIMRHQDQRTTTEVYGHLQTTYLKTQIERLSFGPEPADLSGGGQPSRAADEQQSRARGGWRFGAAVTRAPLRLAAPFGTHPPDPPCTADPARKDWKGSSRV